MTETATPNRRPLRNVVATVASVEQKVNTNGKPFVVAKTTLAGGRKQTLMTYYKPMMERLMQGGVGAKHAFYGVFEGNTFAPIGVTQPRQKAA